LRWLLLAASIAVLLAVAAGCWHHRGRDTGTTPAASAASFVDEAGCRDCHAAEYAAWSGSHHARAMQQPTPASVSGDFGGVQFSGRSGVAARFFERDGGYLIRTTGPDGHDANFRVRFTFGVDPLQQYLLPLPGGRLQAFSVAWDTRRRRWFDLNPAETIGPDDELHWSDAAYNWNYMCAECHSTGVRKNYDAGTNSYRTAYAAVNVNCQACHGPASHHLEAMRQRGRATARREDALIDPMLRRDATAQIGTCALCHARRAALGGRHLPGAPLLDTHTPALLVDPLYYADGQIRGEVYEYGSFLQSRMYARGVRCSDCHEPHGLQLRAVGNAVCTACHSAAVPTTRHAIDTSGLKRRDYDSPAHHFHVTGKPGSHCIDCHMPTRTYMRVDNRHDHSLRIPRPDLSVRLGTPNSCNGCHRDRSPAWAATAVARWYGPNRRREYTYGEALSTARRREPGAARALFALIQDATQPAIVRATALGLLRGFPGAASLRLFSASLSDPDPMIRLQAVGGFEQVAADERVAYLGPMLDDPIRAVRMEAARLLASLPVDRQRPATAGALRRGIAEFEASQHANADRPEAHLNLGNLFAARGDAAAAAAEYRAALRLDARFGPAVANLADLQASRGELRQAEQTLRRGLERLPNDAALHHALGLILIRRGRVEAALAELKRAMQEAPDEPRYLYVYGVALHDVSDAAAGIAMLHAGLRRFPNDHDLLLAVASYARAAGDTATAQQCLERLRSIEEPAAAQATTSAASRRSLAAPDPPCDRDRGRGTQAAAEEDARVTEPRGHRAEQRTAQAHGQVEERAERPQRGAAVLWRHGPDGDDAETRIHH
jgi:predicted CXXCH cytochrome family protein